MTDRHDDPERLGRTLGAADEREADEFEAVAAQLGFAAEPVAPRPEMKAALFARLDATPQLPAQAQAQAPVQEASSEAPAPSAVAGDPTPAPAAQPPLTPAERTAQRRWFSRPASILAAAAAAIVLFVGGAVLGSTLAGNDSTQQQQAEALADLNAAGDVQRASTEVAGGGTATLVWSAELGRSALIAHDLPQLSDGKVYELWYMHDGEATPAGTLRPADSGATWRVLNGEMTAGATVGVTVEPRGGSDEPTSAPILTIPS